MNKDIKVLDTDFPFNKELPLNEYPRPQLKRNSFLNLNGIWDFKLFNDHNIFINYDRKIVVPYPIESALSGVEEEIDEGLKIGYRKEFFFPEGFIKDKTLLHFGAVDQVCDVYYNRNFVCHHEGGYTPFTIDVTKFLRPNRNEVVVIVKDDLENIYPTGKQKKKNGGIWYTPVSGIWQTVWMESVNFEYLQNIKYTPNIDNKEIKMEFTVDSIEETIEKEIIISYKGKLLKKVKTDLNEITIPLEKLYLWSPDTPNLYDVIINVAEDEVSSYFAMRKYSVEDIEGQKLLMLNNKPYFFHGLLDQGWYPDGLYTPKSYDVYRYELSTIKELGFNTLRKHIKIEPLIWYNLCDTMGIIVWQDLVNVGEYSFLKDTALPTIGKQKSKLFGFKVAKIAQDNFVIHMNEVVNHLYNVPSIALWTIFNEGWGQFDTVANRERLKALDNTRFIDSASGWFYKDGENDLDSFHIYFKKIDFEKHPNKKYAGASNRPIIISEFGGYAYKVVGHVYDDNHEYGYRKIDTLENFNKAFKELYENEIIGNLDKGISASIYTQVSDVEEEINGILTYDRKVCKLDKDMAMDISNRLRRNAGKDK